MNANRSPNTRFRRHAHTLNAAVVFLAGAAPLALGLSAVSAPPVSIAPRASLGGGAMGSAASPFGGINAAGAQSLTGSAALPGAANATGASLNGAAATAKQGTVDAATQGSVETIGTRQERIDVARTTEIKTGSSGSAVDAIESGSFDGRAALGSGITARLDSDDEEFAKMKVRAATDEGRDDFRSAMAEARERGRRLRESVKATSKATPEAWASARADLSADFGAYAAAEARARVLAVAGPAKASEMLEAGTTIDTVHSTGYGIRLQATDTVKAKLAASSEAVAALKKH
jgi:hypothetical protein